MLDQNLRIKNSGVLAKILKMHVNSENSACLDLALLKLLQILRYQLHLIVCCVKMGNLHFSYVVEYGLFVKYLVITPTMVKIENLPVQKVVFRKLLIQKTSWVGPG